MSRPPLPIIKRSRARNAVAVVVASGVAIAAVPLVMFGAGGATELLAACPVRGDVLALVVGEVARGDAGPTVTSRYAVYDARSGLLRGTLDLGTLAGDLGPTCALAPDGLHHRVVDPLGHATLLDPDAARVAAPAAAPDAPAAPVAPVVPEGVIPYRVGGDPRLTLADGRALRLDGHPLARLVGPAGPLCGGRAFRQPSLVPAPRPAGANGPRGVVWPDPPSVIVAEETAEGSLTWRLARVTLDGRELWSVIPEHPSPPTWRGRPVPWAPTADGAAVVHFERERMIAVDPRTGGRIWVGTYRGGAL